MKKENLTLRQAKKLLKGKQDMENILKSRLGFYSKNLSEMKYTKELPYVINIRNREITLENNPRYPEGIDDNILAPYDFVNEDRRKILQKELSELNDKLEEANSKRLDAEDKLNEEKIQFEDNIRNMEYLTPGNVEDIKGMHKSKYRFILTVCLIFIGVLVSAEIFSLMQQFLDFFGIEKNDSVFEFPLEYLKVVAFSAAVFLGLFALAHWIFKSGNNFYKNHITGNNIVSQSIEGK